MTENSMRTLVLLPVLAPLLGAAVAVLLSNFRRAQAGWALGTILVSLLSSLLLLVQVWQTESPLVFQLGGWPAPYGISLVADLLSAVMVVMTHLVMSAGILYSFGSKEHVIQYPGYYALFLTLATGLTGALMSGDLFNLFVFAELLVISGTVLTAISDDRYGTEAAFKYLLISLLASVFLLVAVGSLYVSYGTLNMADLAERIAADPYRPLTSTAMVFLMGSFMIKAAVVPFHFWQPDFHTAAPTPVSAMLSSVVVKLGVYGFLRMTTLLFLEQAPVIRSLLLVLGVVGIVFGGLSAIGTHNAKRMLAYSTLAQVGFILVGIGWGTVPALAAAVVFAFNHSLVKAAMLMLAGAVASRAPVKSAGFDIITGVGKVTPTAGALFLLGGLALAGIPPTNGFVSKLALFRSGVLAGEYLWLAGIAVASILTLIYIGRAFQRIWWQPSAPGQEAKPYGDRVAAPAVLIGISVLLGIWAEPLLRVAQETAAWMGDPEIYIRAVLGM